MDFKYRHRFKLKFMNCKNFGIGLIVLSVTLFIGITIGEISKLNEIFEIAVIEEKALAEAVLKDCVPADSDLKYHFIAEDETKTISLKVENVEELKKLLNKGEADSETEKKLKKIEKEAELRDSSFQTLGFVQKCRAEKKSR